MLIGASVEAVKAVAGHLGREWGEYGYRLSVEGLTYGQRVSGQLQRLFGADYSDAMDRDWESVQS